MAETFGGQKKTSYLNSLESSDFHAHQTAHDWPIRVVRQTPLP